jgi:RES domain-containing protein
MEVYRIVHRKRSRSLLASGNEARWNSAGNYCIYTSGSRALSCLENIVHRSGEGLSEIFRVMVIEIPSATTIDVFDVRRLPDNWETLENYSITQRWGDEWLRKFSSPALKVPSAIIPQEFNYLINPLHRDFKKIKLKKVEAFQFDPRIIQRKK